MDYRLIRNEQRLSPDGSGATEIFICIEMDDGAGGLYPFGYWLTPAEVAAVLADGSVMDGVVASAAIKGEQAFNEYKLMDFAPPEEPPQ